MAVDPLGRIGSTPSGQVRTDGNRRTDESTAGAAAAPDSSATILAADILALSSNALESTRAEAVPTGELSSDQLRNIRQRLTDGGYDTSEVQSIISEHVLREIQLPVAWGGLG